MFVRACSGWSLGCGLLRPDLLLEWAGRSGLSSVCLADYDNLYGAVEFYERAKGQGIRPILGAVITERPGEGCSTSKGPCNRGAAVGRSDMALVRGLRAASSGPCRPDSSGAYHPPARSDEDCSTSPAEEEILLGRTKLIVQRLDAPQYVAIACNLAGYENLCRLVTARHVAGSFDLAQAAGQHQHGLVFLVSDPVLLRGMARYVEPVHLFAEMADYGDEASRGRCYRLLEAAGKMGIEPVASHAAYFGTPREWHLHRVLRGVVLNQLASRVPAGQLVPAGAWLASIEQIRDRLGRYGRRAIRNAQRLFEQADLRLQLGAPHFPKVALPAGETACARLCRLAWEGLARRYEKAPQEAVPRIKHELNVITKMGFADYFLVVHEIVQFARSKNIGCVGRGSAADSLVTYCLGISDVDPLRYKLHFERFLNESRTDYPDIDLDFDWRRRDEVIRFVYEHWGRDHVAMISTQHFYKARSAFRDAARALGMPTEKLNRLTRKLPYDEADNLQRAIGSMPECRDFPMHDPQVAKAVRIAEHLAGLPRGLSVHVGGVVIAPRELVCYSPLQPATKGIAITQYDMRAIEKVGLVKIDLLGHRSLAILADALDLVERDHGVRVDLPSLPEDDPETARVLTTGRTVGCFQIESPGVRQLLQMLQAKDLQDIIHALSLIRPGPSASGMKERFIKRKRGLEPVTYLHPAMREVLAETYGVMLYQEDVMMVAAAVAGFTMATGDSLRKALEKPDSHEQMARLKATFVAGARQRGCDEPTAEQIWLLVSNFAAYSYNKAHACTYGRISYWCTWMKTHYPAEFLTGVLNNVGGYYSLSEYLEEARRQGVPILPVHVNESGLDFAAKPVAVVRAVARRRETGDATAGVRTEDWGLSNSNDKATRGRGDAETRGDGRTEDWGLRTEEQQRQGSGFRVQGSGNGNNGRGSQASRLNGEGGRCEGGRQQRLDSSGLEREDPWNVLYDPRNDRLGQAAGRCNPWDVHSDSRGDRPGRAGDALDPCSGRAGLTLRRVGIRVALRQVRNLSEKVATAIIEQRGQGGPFVSLEDLLGRVRMSSEEARALIFCGACDGMGPSRPAMLWQLSAGLRQGRLGGAGGQPPVSLFTGVEPEEGPDDKPGPADKFLPIVQRSGEQAAADDLPAHLVRDYSRQRLMELERQYLTFSPGDHAMGAWADATANQDIVRSVDLPNLVGRVVTVAGIIVATRKAVTRSRELMQFVSIEDRWGLVEVVLFPDVYKRIGGTFGSFGPYRVRGVVQENLGSVVLVGRSVELLSEPAPAAGHCLEGAADALPHLPEGS